MERRNGRKQGGRGMRKYIYNIPEVIPGKLTPTDLRSTDRDDKSHSGSSGVLKRKGFTDRAQSDNFEQNVIKSGFIKRLSRNYTNI